MTQTPPADATPQPARPTCACATAFPTYPVFRRAYHIPPCPHATKEQLDAAEGARVLREEEIPREAAERRARGVSERAIATLTGQMRATAVRLEHIALNGRTPDV